MLPIIYNILILLIIYECNISSNVLKLYNIYNNIKQNSSIHFVVKLYLIIYFHFLL